MTIESKKGLFWLPIKPENIVAGFLKYSDEKIELDLVGCFENSSDPDAKTDFLIINGILGQQRVLLYDSFENYRNIHIGGIDYTRLTVNIIFFGIHASKPSDFLFHKISFHPSHYDKFVNHKAGWNINYDRSKKRTTVEYELPESIETTIQKGLKSIIGFRASVPTYGFHLKEISISQSTYYSIENTRKKPLHDLLKLASHYSKLVMLFTQRPTYMDDLQLLFKNKGDRDFNTSDLFRTSRTKVPSKKLSPNDFLIYFADISSMYDTILINWYKDEAKYETSLNSYFDTYFESGNVDDFALKILKSMESYHREFIGPKSKDLVKRYQELFERVRKVFNPILRISSKRSYCEKLKTLRHDLAHNNPLKVTRTGVFKTRYRIAIETRMILTANVLLDLGIPTAQLAKLFWRSGEYIYLRKK